MEVPGPGMEVPGPGMEVPGPGMEVPGPGPDQYRVAAGCTVLAVLVYSVLRLGLDRYRRRRARVPVLVVGSGPAGLAAALVAVRSGRVSRLTVLEERNRAAMLTRAQLVCLDPRSVRFLSRLGVDLQNLDGCWRTGTFCTRIGVLQEHLLGLLEHREHREHRDQVQVRVQLGTKFSEDFLRRLPAAERPRVIVVADGAAGQSCSVLGISSAYSVENCHAYAANAVLEREEQRQVPAPEIRAHGVYLDLSAYGLESPTARPAFHLKIYGTFRNRYMALVCPASQSRTAHFLRHTANSSVMRNIFLASFNAYKSDLEPRLSDAALHTLQCSRRLFQVQLSHRRVSAAYREEDGVAVTVEGEAARVLNFDTGCGVNLALRGLESLEAFLCGTAVASDRRDVLEALRMKTLHSRQLEEDYRDHGLQEDIYS